MLITICIYLAILFINAEEEAFAQEDLSPFESVLKSKLFIDKSLLLKEIINGEPMVSITVPRKFGKSTNLDMIKRFLEIEVDDDGNPLPFSKGTNYKLFKENNLTILQDKEFFKNHFGHYPVVYINYGPLIEIGSIADFTKKYTRVISETFSQHEYLLNNRTLWANDSESTLFESLVSDVTNKDQIPPSFQWLCKLLRRHFGKKVFVLMDESDAVIESLIFSANDDLFDITELLRETESSLFHSRDKVGAVLVGVIKVFRKGCEKIISHHPFLTSTKYGKFFGITQEELDGLLKTHINDEQTLFQTTNRINKFYNGYLLFHGGRTILYNTWPIINYIETQTMASDYLCKLEYVYLFKKLCSVYGLTEWIQNLILEKEVPQSHIQVEKPLFRRRHILILNYAVKYNIVDPGKNTTKVFLTLLYHLGYLTPMDGKLQSFTIPNRELRKEMKNYIPDRPIDPLADI